MTPSRWSTWLWRRYARTYDSLQDLTGYQEMLDMVVEMVGEVKNRTVVETGCGTGNLLLRLAPQAPARMIGIDPSPAMLAPAQAKLSGRSATETVELVLADAVVGMKALPPRMADVIVAANVLYALPDRQAFWAEAARVLTPKGRVIISNPDRAGFLPVIRQQWRERGWRGFTNPQLIEVCLLNVVIDIIAKTGAYCFLPWDALSMEAAESGLQETTAPRRCYGGTRDGINVVGSLSL